MNTIATAVMLVMSNAVTRRVVEEISIRGTTLLRETTTDFVIDQASRAPGARLVVPLAAGSRGQLWDTQEAMCSNQPVSILVHAENVVFGRAVLAECWHRTFLGGRDLGSTLHAHTLSIPESSPEDARTAVDSLRTALTAWRKDDEDRRVRADDLCDVAEFFSRNYLVFVELPVGSGDRIVVTRRVATPYEVRRRGPLRRWRRSAGLRPVTLSIPLYGAPFRAMSYHLRVKAPEGYHVHVNELLVGAVSLTPWRFEPKPSTRVLWSPNGGDYAHLYIPNSEADAAARREALVAKVKFAEDLPGSLIGSFVPAAMIAVLTLLSLVVYPRVFPFASSDPSQSSLDQANSSFAALLLAIPGITSLWFRPRHVDELVRIPLTPLVAPFLNGTLSFGLAVLFLGFRLSPCREVVRGTVTNCNPGRRLGLWIAMTVIAVVWAAYLLWLVVSKHRAERDCPPQHVEEQPDPARPRNPMPNRPPRWMGWWSGGEDPLRAPPRARPTTLDALYEALEPPSRRGDVYMVRADSFDFPFDASTRENTDGLPEIAGRMARLLKPRRQWHRQASA
jgi:hypothetical protein